jgi:hypothetical protein
VLRPARRPRLYFITLFLTLATALPLAHAHGGEDHSHEQPKAAAPAAGPAAARPDSAAPAGAASLEASARLPDGSLFVP